MPSRVTLRHGGAADRIDDHVDPTSVGEMPNFIAHPIA
jgi:hypothetical protein